jgi:uncharacterized coiled-coil DUF342 family protein
MKITKRQLRRIIKEEKAKLLNEAYDPVSELYDIQQALSDAGHKMKEVSNFLRGSTGEGRRPDQFESLSRQILKINTTIETHVKTLENSERDDAYRDYKPTEPTPHDPYGNRKV